jgi:hypothetical protein
MRALLALALLCAPALARDNGQWGDQPTEIRQWFQSVMQPENPYMSCCGEADAFEVQLEGDEPDGSIAVRIIAGPDPEAIGAEIDVPRSKLQARYGNPLDKYILFIGSGGRIYCLIPKVGA